LKCYCINHVADRLKSVGAAIQNWYRIREELKQGDFLPKALLGDFECLGP
jgi:hypothetical protein